MNVFKKPLSLEQQLDDAQHQLAEDESILAAAALASSSGPGVCLVAGTFDELKAAATATRDRVEMLTVALREQRRLAHERAIDGRAKIQASQLRVLSKALRRRNEAGLRFSEALVAADRAWQEMVAADHEARDACPTGLSYPSAVRMDDAVDAELYRIAGRLGPIPGTGPKLPFAPAHQWGDPPSKQPPLADVLEADAASVRRRLQDGIDAARFAPRNSDEAA